MVMALILRGVQTARVHQHGTMKVRILSAFDGKRSLTFWSGGGDGGGSSEGVVALATLLFHPLGRVSMCCMDVIPTSLPRERTKSLMLGMQQAGGIMRPDWKCVAFSINADLETFNRT